AARCGIKTIIIPRANAQDVLLDSQFDHVEVIAVDSLDEVMEHALIKGEKKTSLVKRLGAVIDRLTPEISPSSQLS
ncbi:MAG TPA: ATP-dependent protease LonB, partial [Candidatus Poseidoniales archaeon]|nr:ATP-dependent protease LonB [Candidatus Poseidoniales archaeon]